MPRSPGGEAARGVPGPAPHPPPKRFYRPRKARRRSVGIAFTFALQFCNFFETLQFFLKRDSSNLSSAAFLGSSFGARPVLMKNKVHNLR